MFKFLRKKTREQLILEKSESVFFNLMYDSNYTFSNIEKVEILNNVRLRLSYDMNCQKRNLMMESVTNNQKAKEITSLLNEIDSLCQTTKNAL